MALKGPYKTMADQGYIFVFRTYEAATLRRPIPDELALA
jgi:hypothetical protein